MNTGQVKNLIDSYGKRVIEILLPPEADVPWHVHSAVIEYCYCLSGQFDFEKYGSEAITLHPGTHCKVPVCIPHRVVNRSRKDCRFLIVQTGGYYDFVHLKSRG